MKVLMFGWEYPPHVFGGLATANYGISEGLKAQGDIETVLCLPHPFGDESQHACRIVAMNAVPESRMSAICRIVSASSTTKKRDERELRADGAVSVIASRSSITSCGTGRVES